MTRWFDFLKRAWQSRYAQGAVVLIGGSALTQLIPLLASPFIGRIFLPEDFGVYSVFLSVVNIIGGCACLKYELAAVSARDEKTAFGIVFLCVILSLAVSLLLFAVLLIWGKTHLIWAPLSTFFTSIFASANCLMLSLGRYKTATGAALVKSLVMYLFQIALGALGFGYSALIFGQALGYACGCAVMLAPYLRQIFFTALKRQKLTPKNFKAFPALPLAEACLRYSAQTLWFFLFLISTAKRFLADTAPLIKF